jgi:hypothetical protein
MYARMWRLQQDEQREAPQAATAGADREEESALEVAVTERVGGLERAPGRR